MLVENMKSHPAKVYYGRGDTARRGEPNPIPEGKRRTQPKPEGILILILILIMEICIGR